MPHKNSRDDPDRDRRARLVAWFSILAESRAQSDYVRAAQALRELEQRGVVVRFRRRRRQGVDHGR